MQIILLLFIEQIIEFEEASMMLLCQVLKLLLPSYPGILWRDSHCKRQHLEIKPENDKMTQCYDSIRYSLDVTHVLY